MKKDIFKEIIRDFHKGGAPDTKARTVIIPSNSGKIVTLSGVRRSGKTFILFRTIQELLSRKIAKENILYVNFEDERLELKQEDLDLLLQGYRELYPDNSLSECYFFFDEVQNIAGWEKFVRRIYDTVTKNIFITGSNSKLLSKEIATSLRGRTVTFEVFPLSFEEFLNFQNIEIDIHHSKTRAKIINAFERYLFEGGFPELVAPAAAEVRNKVLQEYFDVMLYRDMVERFNITNIPVLKYFLKRVFESITGPLSVNNIFHELKSQGYKIGKNALYEYIDAAESIYLFLILKKYSESVLKRELAEKKVYAIDNGLLNAVTFRFSKDYGKLLENLVFLELHKKRHQIFYFKNRKECDFIILENSGSKRVLQVCYSIADRETRAREVKGLVEACKRFGIKEGLIITFSEELELQEEGVSIHIMPAYKFFLLEKALF